MSKLTYILVTLSYWFFMLTDGALRMLSLLHFHENGFNPVQLAFLFVLYEIAGVLTNLYGGYIGGKFGLKHTLFYGLGLQIIALLALTQVADSWGVVVSVAFVMLFQALSGVAKDLTKMSSKSSVKLLIKEGSADSEEKLFKWVAALTGSKNAIKGVGFFLGGFLLAQFGYRESLFMMAALIGVIFVISISTIRGDFGKSSAAKSAKFSQLFAKSRAINVLSLARAFLFSARDVWFVVGIPIFFHEHLGWSFTQVGTLMASWVIAYGFIQGIAPKIVGIRKSSGEVSQGTLAHAVKSAQYYAYPLTAICVLMALSLVFNFYPSVSIITGLFLFGFFFAINSSVHSYLILAYTDKDNVAMNVGFYYMANAIGRLCGTVLSGTAYLVGGLEACLYTSGALALAAALIAKLFPSSVEEPISATKPLNV